MSTINCPKCSKSMTNGGGAQSHIKRCLGGGKNGSNGHAPRTNYSVMSIDCEGIVIRGAEIEGKFHRITDDAQITVHPSIRAAIDAAKVLTIEGEL